MPGRRQGALAAGNGSDGQPLLPLEEVLAFLPCTCTGPDSIDKPVAVTAPPESTGDAGTPAAANEQPTTESADATPETAEPPVAPDQPAPEQPAASDPPPAPAALQRAKTCEYCGVFLARVVALAAAKDAVFKPAAAALLARHGKQRRPSLAARLVLKARGESASPQRSCSSSSRGNTPPPTPSQDSEADGTSQFTPGTPSSASSLSLADGAERNAAVEAAEAAVVGSPLGRQRHEPEDGSPGQPEQHDDSEGEGPADALAQQQEEGAEGAAAAAASEASSQSPTSPVTTAAAALGGGKAGATTAAAPPLPLCGDPACEACACEAAAEARALLEQAAADVTQIRVALSAFDMHHRTTRGRRFADECSRTYAFMGGAPVTHDLRALTVHSRAELEDEEAGLSRYVSCPICLGLMLKPMALRCCCHCVCGDCLSLLAADAARRRRLTVRCPVCRAASLAAEAAPLTQWDRVLRRLYPEEDPVALAKQRRAQRKGRPAAVLRRVGRSLGRSGKALLPEIRLSPHA